MFPISVHLIQWITPGYFYPHCSIDLTWIIVNNIDIYMCGMLLSRSKNMQPVTVKTTQYHACHTFGAKMSQKLIFFYIYPPNPAYTAT